MICRKLMTILLLPMALTGCGSANNWFKDQAYGDYSVGHLSYDKKDTPYGKLLSSISADLNDNGACFSAPAAANRAAWTADCTLKRKMVVGDLLTLSDAMCQDHQRTIWGNEAAVNMFTGTLTNAFSGAAVVVGGAAAKSALSAVAAFASGERSLINESVYKNALIPAVVKKIEEARPIEKKAVMDKVNSQPIEDYPLNMAVSDVLSYHYKCSFMYGLQKAIEEGVQPSKEAQIGKLDQRRSLVDAKRRALAAQLSADSKDPANDTMYKALDAEVDTLSKSISGLSSQP